MFKRLGTSCCLAILFSAVVFAARPLPAVVVIATGGTIAGQGAGGVQSQYEPARTPVEDLLRAVPELGTLALVSGVQYCQIASQDMTPELWLGLAARVEQLLDGDAVDGVVITHGTDTLEETAFFLHLVTASDKPVVFTAAMRPPTSRSADGALNLYNAVAVAATASSRGRGVLVVMNDVIHSAREVTKRHTTRLDAFESPVYGPLGEVFYGEIAYYRSGERRHTAAAGFHQLPDAGLPRVDILYGYAGSPPDQVECAVANGARGIVYVGTGNGNPGQAVLEQLAAAAAAGVVVVRASRPGTGRVTLDAEVDDARYGFIVADNLNPQKSRILLMLALSQAADRNVIQQLFFDY